MPRLQLSSLLLVLCLLPGVGQAAGKCERLVATGNPEYPPYLWRDPENPKQLIGANADLLKQIAKELGLKVEILYTGPWSRAQDEVRTGRVDLIAGAFLTLPRLETMDYVHPAFLETQSVVWVKRERAFPYSGWEDLRSHIGGTLVKNSFGEAFDRFAKENLKLEEVPSLTQAYQKLLLERTDYVLYERYPGLVLADTLGMADDLAALEPPISSEGLYLTLSHNSACNDPWLRGQLAKKMTELVAAGVPETLLQRNLERWKALQMMQPAGTPE
ncbi:MULTISPECIES: ABC transporter substrate-binding protein [unclassified Pseudomonas]|jgi:polar amino acid transport system substrate-binding protein|uniref:substrate-binding periplasmic protein n=1 Tax=unclassified Pseudomonas TaxID=196821 RepID=UPI000EA85968|nr:MULTISPECIES: transporter substrate-binding domain-containing protein [unclassified Pseudomonas]AYF86087.1 amino acid ABC transporter substrate-binding protein [Pseudomonas sp. DY-1]MDH4654268.1 transporter substrate-binding domain-containing protein [Pseudomonas sp. BN606]MRK19392.1 transporter substrate-binding domain-containing protein [Pseudomonas sp. JG-B]